MLPFQGSAAFGGPAHIKLELIQEKETIQPGQPFWVALKLNIEEGWHVLLEKSRGCGDAFESGMEFTCWF